MRINKLLSNYGYCSRKTAGEWLEAGRIRVNGVQASPGMWVEEKDDILLDGHPLKRKPPVYLAFHKPRGIECTHDEERPGNIKRFIRYAEYIFPVGRLDRDSEGLILLTNDGDTASRIISSEHAHEKTYTVTVDKEVTEDFIAAIQAPMNIKIGITKPCLADKISEHTFQIVLTQGMNRQIRRMCGALGYTVLKLVRTRILDITLEGLPLGCHRHLTPAEILSLKK